MPAEHRPGRARSGLSSVTGTRRGTRRTVGPSGGHPGTDCAGRTRTFLRGPNVEGAPDAGWVGPGIEPEPGGVSDDHAVRVQSWAVSLPSRVGAVVISRRVVRRSPPRRSLIFEAVLGSGGARTCSP